MPALSWNEIRHNAIRFSNGWTCETREHAEAKSFWDEFFAVFGIRRRTVASFEEPVKKITGDYGYIDLFWPAVVQLRRYAWTEKLPQHSHRFWLPVINAFPRFVRKVNCNRCS
jgi:hypothetical protein